MCAPASLTRTRTLVVVLTQTVVAATSLSRSMLRGGILGARTHPATPHSLDSDTGQGCGTAWLACGHTAARKPSAGTCIIRVKPTVAAAVKVGGAGAC